MIRSLWVGRPLGIIGEALGSSLGSEAGASARLHGLTDGHSSGEGGGHAAQATDSDDASTHATGHVSDASE